jgi:hypothetical protein
MKISKTLSMVIVCVIVVTVFGAVTVYAPPTGDRGKVQTQLLHKYKNNTSTVQNIGGDTMETWYINNIQG